MKIATIIGHFGFGYECLDGQTVKTKIITSELKREYTEEKIDLFDTHYVKKKPIRSFFAVTKSVRKSDNIIILPAQNGLLYLPPFLVFLNFFFRKKLHYVVIGGWLPTFLQKHRFVANTIKKFDYIYVETNAMKTALDADGFENVLVMPNCKKLNILKEDELVISESEPYRFCTFSRVMKEKGIKEAIDAVKKVNKTFGRTVCSLDIYGQIDPEEKVWFDELKLTFPEYVRYAGLVPFNQSTAVLKDYFALLFPTYYHGEGFAGTLIDAMAAGLPVIASDWKYNSEILIPNKTGVIYSLQEEAGLENAIFSSLKNTEEWNAMKPKCLEEAKKYSPEFVTRILKENL